MKSSLNETTYFRRSRTLDGRVRAVTVGKRNGGSAAFFSPDWVSLELDLNPHKKGARRRSQIHEELCVNLNPIERRTWEQIINEWSIDDIARSENTTRTAIYERIRGNSKGQGGMIQKNPYVALWWALRLRRQLARKLKSKNA